MIEINKTERGFRVGTFLDDYGHECSIQQSSIATRNCLWLGINNANPQIMARDAKRYDLNPGTDVGWVSYPIPEDVLLTTRMHLNQDQVAMLIDALSTWLEHGELPSEMIGY